MRIVVNGQQAFGKAVLESLLEKGEEVIAVYCAPEKPGERPDPLREAAEEAGLPLFQPASFKAPEVWEGLRAMEPDLCVMAFVTLLVPEEFLNTPQAGTIQYHPSLLPRHRGPSSINWPIIQGEKKTGLTIFWPDKGLDTGPILLQKEVEIRADDTLGSLYFDRLFPMGVEALLEAVELVREGRAPRISQDESLASYESWCNGKQVEIGWENPAEEVYNLIRGANPQPGAWSMLAGKKLKIFDTTTGPEVPGAEAGEVTDITAAGITVAALGGTMEIARVRPEGGKKISAADFARETGLQTGARLGR